MFTVLSKPMSHLISCRQPFFLAGKAHSQVISWFHWHPRTSALTIRIRFHQWRIPSGVTSIWFAPKSHSAIHASVSASKSRVVNEFSVQTHITIHSHSEICSQQLGNDNDTSHSTTYAFYSSNKLSRLQCSFKDARMQPFIQEGFYRTPYVVNHKYAFITVCTVIGYVIVYLGVTLKHTVNGTKFTSPTNLSDLTVSWSL